MLPATTSNVLPVFFAFSCAASCCYVINDLKDLEFDRKHLAKKNRPIANGSVSFVEAGLIILLLAVLSISVSTKVSNVFLIYIIVYFTISLTYTFFLKNIPIIDIFIIAAGFLVRVMAGGEAFHVDISTWLFLTVFLVSLFLASGKRMGELLELGTDAAGHRLSLAGYNLSFIEGALWFFASSALVTYSLYTIEQKSGLFYTVPLATFGLMRYIFLAKQGRGDPTEALLKDKQIMITGIIWLTLISVVVYFK